MVMDWQDPHQEIEHLFNDLLPARGMTKRAEQIKLSHRLLDAMLDRDIALCDAGTGIGKTFSYLVAGIVFLRFCRSCGLDFQPVIISTSSIALQQAVKNEYIPFLSEILLKEKLIEQPIQAVIRKGKRHYVCDERLRWRLREIHPEARNVESVLALRSLLENPGIAETDGLRSYEKKRICVPRICQCRRRNCRYFAFLRQCNTTPYLFHICNHNLLLADRIQRHEKYRPILPDCSALIIDEAHKLPETARQMLSVTLESGDIKMMERILYSNKYDAEATALAKISAPLLRKLDKEPDNESFDSYIRMLAGISRVLKSIHRKFQYNLTFPFPVLKYLEWLLETIAVFLDGRSQKVFYAAEQENGGSILVGADMKLAEHLQNLLWNLPRPILLVSATLSVGNDFHRFREESGLLSDYRVVESVSPSPFDYQNNCLLYFPQSPVSLKDTQEEAYYDWLAGEILALVQSTCGHALILFTSYSAMSAVKERLLKRKLRWSIYTMNRNSKNTVERFKENPGSILLATGAAWEGLDFPGDSVSLLIIPRLPFPTPNAVSEERKKSYPSLQDFIRSIVVPDMQIKLRQGFGRAIRTESDTCVVAILDERAVPKGRYYHDVIKALPEMRKTRSLKDVKHFIHAVKPRSYFQEINQPPDV